MLITIHQPSELVFEMADKVLLLSGGECSYFGPGDGSVPEESLRGLPGMDPSLVWNITPKEHHDMPSDHDARRLSLEALLATDRRVAPSTPEPTVRISRRRSGALRRV